MKLHGFFFPPPVKPTFIGHQLTEIYRDGVYEPFFQGKSGLTIVDIGANIGMTAYYFSQYAKVVHAVEPSLNHFNTIKHMLEYNEIKNVELHKTAIWKEDTVLPFYHNGNHTMFSLHTAVDDGSEQPEKVKVMRLDTFFKENKIDKCDFLKIDIEGSEYELVASEGFENVADRISTVFLEYHKWAGRNPTQLKQNLELYGYRVTMPQSTAGLMVGQR